jgi:sigma-B regulation protein RsbU (phosphoserine phosphatase)
MNAFLFLLAGATVGILGCFYFGKISKRKLSALRAEKIRLQKEKEIIVEFMHNLAVAIGEGVARKDLYQRIVHTAVITTGAMSACVYEKLESGKLRGIATEGLFPPQRRMKDPLGEETSTRASFLEKILSSEILEEGEGIVGEVAKTGKPVFVANAQSDPRIVKHPDPALAVRSMVYSPLIHDDSILGVLVVANPSSGLTFSEMDLSLVNSLAEQAALAIKNSDAMNLRLEKSRMDSDLGLAKEVQELFLAQKSPESKGLDVDAQYLPSSQVGGDFYDFYKLSPTKFGVCIADVSGKGVPASLLMAICQTNLRHYVSKTRSPSAVLKKLNLDLEKRIREDMFITLFLAIIDTQANTATYARAGHEPALLAKQGEEDETAIDKLHGNGMALGMVPADFFDEAIEDKVVPFEKGDVMVLFTDGVTEAENEDREEFGLSRLSDKLSARIHLKPNEFNRRLLSDLDEYSSTSYERDDITIVTLKRV